MSHPGYSSAMIKRPNGQNATGSSRHGDDSDRYGGSRPAGGDRARKRDLYGDRRHKRSGGQLKPRHRDEYEESEEDYTEEKRFIPCTIRTIPVGAKSLGEFFKVSVDMVAEWCDLQYIRIDKTKDPRDLAFLNIDPLREVVAKKAWERYEKHMRDKRNEMEALKHMESLGFRPRGMHDFENDEDLFDEKWDDEDLARRRRRLYPSGEYENDDWDY